jgi:hypothetical protein
MNTTRRKMRLPAVKWGLTLVGFLGILLLATSCLDDDNNNQNTTPTEVAYVSLYNASPDAPNLDVIVDDRRINRSPFDYSEYTGYMPFYTGSRNLRIGPNGANNVVVDTTLQLLNAHAYSIFVVDNYQHADLLVIEDTGEPGSGQAMVRFLNLSPDAPAINLSNDDSGTPLFSNQSFKATTAFKPVTAGTFDLRITSTDGAQELLNIPDATFVAGRYYTVIVRGYQTPPSGNTHVLSSEVIIE